MQIFDFLVKMTLWDIISQKSINMFLGDEPHGSPGEFRYVKFPHGVDTKVTMEMIPPVLQNHTRIVIVSDTHERHEKLTLPPADILIHCGDVLMTSKYVSKNTGIEKLHLFNQWLGLQPCKKRIVIGGNHDMIMERIGRDACQAILTNAVYLENDLIELDNLKLFGSPLSAGKSGNKAFQSAHFEGKTIEQAPEKVDILLTHGHCPKLESQVKHSVHIWGHNHSSYGIRRPPSMLRGHPVRSLSICVPIMDRKFSPTHLPVILDMPTDPSVLAEAGAVHAFATTMASTGEISHIDDTLPKSLGKGRTFFPLSGWKSVSTHSDRVAIDSDSR